MTRAALAPLPALLLLAACGPSEDPAQAWATEPPPFPEVLMIRRLQPEDAGDAALLRGTLVVRDSCLRLQRGDESWLLLWPAEARLSVAAAHDVSVDGEQGKGQQMVRVGETIAVGGGELGHDALARVGPGRPIDTSAAVPEACPGPLWTVSTFAPEDAGA